MKRRTESPASGLDHPGRRGAAGEAGTSPFEPSPRLRPADDLGVDSLLLVDDEVAFARSLAEGLADHGFDVRVAHDGFEGYRQAKEPGFDVVVLDLMLPRMSGVEVCRRLRAEDVTTPILMLTAREADSDEAGLAGLGCGRLPAQAVLVPGAGRAMPGPREKGRTGGLVRADRRGPRAGARAARGPAGRGRTGPPEPPGGRAARVPHADGRRRAVQGRDPRERLGRRGGSGGEPGRGVRRVPEEEARPARRSPA